MSEDMRVPIDIDLNKYTKAQLISIITALHYRSEAFNDFITDALRNVIDERNENTDIGDNQDNITGG